MKRWTFLCALAAGIAGAQDVVTIAGAPPQEATVAFIAAESGVVRHAGPVKNAPHTADAETEFTQTLADGTRIQRKSSSKLARDSQGRTRTEHHSPGMGPLNIEIAPIVMIHDPMAKETIMLNEKEKVARKTKLPEMMWSQASRGEPGANVTFERKIEVRHSSDGPVKAGTKAVVTEDILGPAPVASVAALPGVPAMGMAFYRGGTEVEVESLGKQTVSGVVCEGTRRRHTIPAGDIGNDRAITVVTEEWFSPELQLMVMTKNNDPMHGETIYRLTNLKRGEPDKSLFEIPAGYTVKEDAMPMKIRTLERKP